MRIGILLSTSPESQNSYSVYRISQALLAAGHSIRIFLMDDGVYNATVNRSKKKLFVKMDELISQGVEIALCAMSAEMRGIRKEELLSEVGFSSQSELAEIAKSSDRFLSFG